MKQIVIVRGTPGSGKSTLAKEIQAKHVEADMFFMKNGNYCYDRRKIQDAHLWCQAVTKYYLNQGEDVVVSNTFTMISEMQPYFDMAKAYNSSIKVMECKGDFSNEHDVPAEVILKMKRRWEALPEGIDLYKVEK